MGTTKFGGNKAEVDSDATLALQPKLPEQTLEDLYSRAQKSFKLIKLPPLHEHSLTGPAQAKLWAAFASVHSMYFVMNISRGLWRGLRKKEHRGRIEERHVDLLRAAIAFAGAGLDSALKQLIRDTVRPLIAANKGCRDMYMGFVDSYITSGEVMNRKHLRTILVDERGPASALTELYERHLTGDSLQSVEQVRKVCAALGVNEKDISARLKPGSTLEKMFKARNSIVHELDLKRGGSSEQISRSLKEARQFSREALDVTQLIINEVAKALDNGATKNISA